MSRTVRLISVLLLIASLFTLVSCDRSYDEDEVIAAAKGLIAKSAVLNEIYYGEGIDYFEHSDNNNGVYCEANSVSLGELGFSTVSELKEKTKEVFSLAQSERIFGGAFTGSFSNTGTASAARYYQKVDAEGEPVCIMVHSEYEPLTKGVTVYDLESIKVSRVKGEVVYVTVDVQITNDEGKTQSDTIEVGLFEEKDIGWRIDTPTYCTYNEFKDIYDELQKQ